MYIFVIRIQSFNCRVANISASYCFSRPLTYMRDLLSSFSSASISHRNQAFHHAVRDHPVFPLQSMVISTQSRSAILFLTQEVPWHGTRKNIMRENSSFSQHRYFLHDKFLFNDKSLQIYKCWYSHNKRLFETVLDHKGSWILSHILKRGERYFWW